MPGLEAILESTRRTLPALRTRRKVLERMARSRAAPRELAGALRSGSVSVIAEVKRRSPSAGSINTGLDPIRLAGDYARGGAAAISVLTDEPYFGGSLADLEAVSSTIALPVVRKDFILDEVQLLEARAAGASAALLIVRALDSAALRRLIVFADAIGLGALVEAHAPDEVDRALEAGAHVVGVNARDLDTLAVDTGRAWEALARIPADRVAVAESGMSSRSDVERAAAAGADAVLVGTALAGAGDPAAGVAALAGVRRRGR